MLDLQEQAGVPPLAVEMGFSDRASVIQRLAEDALYIDAFARLFGRDVLENTDVAFDALTESLAEFEKTAAFSSFDSRYDRSLRGEYVYDPFAKATYGRSLFFSQQFTNCATCHQLNPNGRSGETFSSYGYHNIGVPANLTLNALKGRGEEYRDLGLFMNPMVSETSEQGKFKVSTLRNVAVTGPYMHNGVFQSLRTVVEFYDHFFANSVHLVNRETGLPWREPEVADNVALEELRDGRRLTLNEVEALVCFMETLTDARYEHLIPEQPEMTS